MILKKGAIVQNLAKLLGKLKCLFKKCGHYKVPAHKTRGVFRLHVDASCEALHIAF